MFMFICTLGKVRGHPCVKGAIALVTKDVNVELLQRLFLAGFPPSRE